MPFPWEPPGYQPYVPWILSYVPWQKFTNHHSTLAEVPLQGPSYYSYSAFRKQRAWASATMIMFLSELCLEWWNRHSWQGPKIPRIGVGDLSLKTGATPKGHSSHTGGLAVDLATFNRDKTKERDDGKPAGQTNITDYRMGSYDRDMTEEFVRTILDIIDGPGGTRRYEIEKKGSANRFYFSDEKVRAKFGGRLNDWPNHGEHLHIRLLDKTPIGPVPISQIMNKTMPEIVLYIRDTEQLITNVGMLLKAATLAFGSAMSVAVKVLQAVLNGKGGSVLPFLVIDGAFGPKTKARVTEFQRQNGLVSDGIVGPKTKDKLVA